MQKMKNEIKNQKGNENRNKSKEAKKLIENLNNAAAKALIILSIFSSCIGAAGAANFNSGVSVNLEKTIELNDFCTKLNYELKEQSDERIAFQFPTGDWGYVYSNGVVKVGSTKGFSLAQKDVLEREVMQIVKLDENSISALREEQVKDSAVYYMQQAGMFKRVKFKWHSNKWDGDDINLKLIFPDCLIKEGVVKLSKGEVTCIAFNVDSDFVVPWECGDYHITIVKSISKYLSSGTHNLFMRYGGFYFIICST